MNTKIKVLYRVTFNGSRWSNAPSFDNSSALLEVVYPVRLMHGIPIVTKFPKVTFERLSAPKEHLLVKEESEAVSLTLGSSSQHEEPVKNELFDDMGKLLTYLKTRPFKKNGGVARRPLARGTSITHYIQPYSYIQNNCTSSVVKSSFRYSSQATVTSLAVTCEDEFKESLESANFPVVEKTKYEAEIDEYLNSGTLPSFVPAV